MKRMIPLLTLLACILCGCAVNESDIAPESQTQTQTAEASAKAEDTSTKTEEASPQTQEPAETEQERLSELILTARGGGPAECFDGAADPPECSVIPMLFGDFDKDGQEELFAVYGVESGFQNAAAGEVWYACGEEARRLGNNDVPLWDIGGFRVLDEENALVAYSYLAATYNIDHVLKISGSEPMETKIDGFAQMDFEKSEYGGFCAKSSAYDAVYGSGGHTWKPYWYSYDAERNRMVQYGAQEITPEQFREYVGGNDALDGILSDTQNELINILLFDNGIVCINYTREKYANYFRSYDTKGGELCDITPQENSGMYKNPAESGE